MSQRHNCRRCQKPIDACECGDPLAIAERDYGLLPLSLSVNSQETPLGLGGYERPLERCENADEIISRYGEKKQPTIFCAYCDQSIRTRNVSDALAWFRIHKCSGEGEVLVGAFLAA